MKKFTVGIREVHINYVTVEAEDADDARSKALEGEFDECGDLQYDYTPDDPDDVDRWSINELT